MILDTTTLHSKVSMAEIKILLAHHYCFPFYIFLSTTHEIPNPEKNSCEYTENLEVESHGSKIEKNFSIVSAMLFLIPLTLLLLLLLLVLLLSLFLLLLLLLLSSVVASIGTLSCELWAIEKS